MRSLQRLSIGNKLVIAFAALIVGFGALLFYSLERYAELQRETEQKFEHHYQRLSLVQQLRTNLAMLQADLVRTFIDDAPAELDLIERSITRGIEENDRITAALRDTEGDDKAATIVQSLIYERGAIAQARQHMLELVRQGNSAEARQLNATEQRGRLKRVNELGVQLDETTQQQIEAAVAVLRGKLETTRASIFKLSLALIIAGALLAFLLSRHIARPLAELTALAQQISRGEIPRAIAATTREDEVGSLTRAFAEMSRYLRDIVERINEGISVLASSSEEILASTSQAASSTQETATAVSEIAATIEEVKQTALLASERSKVVTESAERTRQVSQEGFQAVDEALKGMRQIREQVLAVAESIMSLGDQMQAIGEIVATVGDLAEQSNLLGVNASIEAVKAGEAGKGFSVVAQEVKALADQSKQATTQVRGILGDIQRAMTKTVMLAEQGSKAVEVGHERAQAGGEVIRMLSASIDESSEVALQIAATSQQQMAGMDQIATAMEYISQASKDNVGGTRQVDVAARNLYELGLKLKGLADRFRL